MLAAHLVPGYFAASITRSHWDDTWTPTQRAGLWIAALGSTVAPDTDVIYNTLVRGFTNHSTLWTHSVFVYLGIALVWASLREGRSAYFRLVVGLIAIGGFSHLALDMIAHDTPLFYPLSMRMIGIAPGHVVEGGLRGYLTHPVVLLEPLLFGVAMWFHVRIRPVME